MSLGVLHEILTIARLLGQLKRVIEHSLVSDSSEEDHSHCYT